MSEDLNIKENAAKTDLLQEKLGLVPDNPGVYLFKNKNGEVIYVGKAKSLRRRVFSYFQSGDKDSPKTRLLVANIADLEYMLVDTEMEAFMLELNLIHKYKPRYNIRLKDDKHYPFIKVTLDEEYPRVFLVRRVKKDGGRYFGPYSDAGAVRNTLNLIHRIFPIRSCKLPVKHGEAVARPCLQYHIGRCLAPCTGKVDLNEYSKLIDRICLFLSNKETEIISELKEEMEKASSELKFERAAVLRDQIRDIEAVTAKQKIISAELDDWDIVALAVGIEYVCAQVYFVRAGRLSGRKNFYLEYNGSSKEEILASFLQQYYGETESIPSLILIPEETGDEVILEEYLRDRKGKKVEVRVPKRGEKKQLLDMAIKNAEQSLEEKELTEDSRYNMTIGALEDLSEILELSYVPNRLECFDISHIQGTDTVASMTVFAGGEPQKSQYRRFKLRSIGDKPNDYLSMQEVLARRFTQGLRERELIESGELEKKKAKFAVFPDLIIIDGGKGQLSAALEILRDLGLGEIPVISLAERLEEIFTKPEGEGILLPNNSRARHLLERIRDEAHRFAITYHRKLRSKRQVKSRLDEIPGIGPKRKKDLLRRFGSIERIKNATVEELLEVDSMNRAAAERLLDYLK